MNNKKNDEPQDYPARVERTDRLFKSQNGEDQKASYVIFVTSSADITAGDRIVLSVISSGTSDRKWDVISVFQANGFDANHKEVFV